MGRGMETRKGKKGQTRTDSIGGGRRAKKAGSSARGAAKTGPGGAPTAAKRVPEPKVEAISDTEGFLAALEYFRKAGAPKRILQTFQAAQNKGVRRMQSIAAAAVKAELRIDREDMADKVVNAHGRDEWNGWLASHPLEAQGVARVACTSNFPGFAVEVLKSAGLWTDNLLAAAAAAAAAAATAAATPNPEVPSATSAPAMVGGLAEGALEAAAAVYPSLVTAQLRSGNRSEAMQLLEVIAKTKLPIQVEASNRLLQTFHKRRDLEAVFKVLDAMAAAGVDGDDQTYEWLANAAVTSVEFVTGAVSMSTLPKEPVLPEAAFIGRSNVGKSSLINMVCNRKALAYTSKTPGKTQQFNYFVVNNNTENAFYLVDMPGMGYARVPEKQRVEWASLFRSYVTRRSSLRVLFHLIDGRHGPVGQDHAIMEMMKEMPDTARYVIVLTKADKSKNSVSKSVVQSLITALRDAGLPRTPVVLTSATSRLGRDGMWRYLRLAALDRVMRAKREANLPDDTGDVLGGGGRGVGFGWMDMLQGDEETLEGADSGSTA